MKRVTILAALLLFAFPSWAATVTDSGATTASTSNATSYAATAFTPTAGDLGVVMVVASGTVATHPTVTDSQNIGYTLVSTTLFAASANSIYIFVANDTWAASSTTVTFKCPEDGATGTVIMIARVSGMTRLGGAAVKQTATTPNHATGSAPSTTFGASALTGNPTLTVVGNSTNPPALTNPTSWTTQANSGYATPTTGGTYASRDSGFTGTAITWGSNSGSAFGAAAIELDTTSPTNGTTPTKGESVASPYYNATSSPSTQGIRLINATATGDAIVAYCKFGGVSGNATFSDDKSNTWAQDVRVDGSSASSLVIGHTQNAASGTTLITVTYPAAQANTECGAIVLNNIATTSALDVSTSLETTVAATVASAGTMTTTADGDYIFCASNLNNVTSPGAVMTWTPFSTSWNLISPDGSSFMSAEGGMFQGHGAITPNFTSSLSSTDTLVGCIALKTASAGGSRGSGAYVQKVLHLNMPENMTPSGTSFTFQVPCDTDTKQLAYIWQSNTLTINSVSSSPSQTWTRIANNVGATQTTGGGYTAVSSTFTLGTTVTFTLSGTPNSTNEVQMSFYCMTGTNGFDVSAANTGSDASTSFPRTLTGVLSITPTTANGIILFIQNEDSQVCDSVNVGIQTAAKMPVYQNIWENQDACLVHYYNPSASAVSFNTTYITVTGSGVGAIDNWTNVAMAFKAIVSSTPPNQFPRIIQ